MHRASFFTRIPPRQLLVRAFASALLCGAATIAQATVGGLTIGGICPVIDATRNFNIRLAPWGYVVFAAVTGLYLVDQVYGFSKSWMRYTVTWLSLRQGLASFYGDWVILTAQCSEAPTSPELAASVLRKQLESLREFRLKIEEQIASETKEWAGGIKEGSAVLQSAAERSKVSKT